MRKYTWQRLCFFTLILAFPSCDGNNILAFGLPLQQSSSILRIQLHSPPTLSPVNNKRCLHDALIVHQYFWKRQQSQLAWKLNRCNLISNSSKEVSQQNTFTTLSTRYHPRSSSTRMVHSTNLNKGEGRYESLFSDKTVLIPRAAAAIGFWGHGGLFLASILLVKTVYATWFNKLENADQMAPAGILSRCPWPFVIFHDPKQFLKDSPTWVVFTWLVLWRLVRMLRR